MHVGPAFGPPDVQRSAPLSSVLFFISGHGFGHASRQVEVINTLGLARPDLTLVIRTAAAPHLLARTLRVPYTLDPRPCDTGIVQSSSVAHDDAATIKAAVAFYGGFDDRVRDEAAALSPDVRLIVTDIAPMACDVGARRQVPVIAIGNFTWDWIYETHPGLASAAPWLVPRLRASYRKATLALELPFSGGFEIFPRRQRIPLIARHATRRRPDARRQFGIPEGRPAALLSFGGYGLPDLDLRKVDCLDAWTIVTTDASARAHGSDHVRFLDEQVFVSTGYRYEDLVAAVDVVITKPGYGISAECVTSGTAMLYTSRGQFREYDVLVREVPRYVGARFISQDDLFAGRWRDALQALLAQPSPQEKLETHGAEVAAQVLGSVLGSGLVS